MHKVFGKQTGFGIGIDAFSGGLGCFVPSVSHKSITSLWEKNSLNANSGFMTVSWTSKPQMHVLASWT